MQFGINMGSSNPRMVLSGAWCGSLKTQLSAVIQLVIDWRCGFSFFSAFISHLKFVTLNIVCSLQSLHSTICVECGLNTENSWVWLDIHEQQRMWILCVWNPAPSSYPYTRLTTFHFVFHIHVWIAWSKFIVMKCKLWCYSSIYWPNLTPCCILVIISFNAWTGR